MSDRVLVFTVAEQRLALPVAVVRECLPLPRLDRRPGLPAPVAGFFVLGPRTLAVIDLARLLDLSPSPPASVDPLYRHLVRLHDDLVLLVDRVLAVADAAPAPTEPVADPWQHGCVARRAMLDDRIVPVLDPAAILRVDERARLAELTRAEQRRHRDWTASVAG